MKDAEAWRVVPSHPHLLASSHGRVMIAPRWQDVNRGTGLRPYGGAPTLGQWDGSRFVYRVKGKTHKVHRLVCEAFNGPCPEEKPVCMHLDENSSNNRPENLAWGTQKENLNAPGFLDYCRSRTGENNPNVKGRRKKAA